MSRVHARHLRTYHDSSWVVTEQLLRHVDYCGFGSVVERVVDHYVLDDHPEDNALHVIWEQQGVPPSWEPMDQIWADAPALVRAYVRRIQDESERSRVQAWLAKHGAGSAASAARRK